MDFLFYLRDKMVAGAFSNKMVLGEPIKPEGHKLELYDIPDTKLKGHFDINFKVGAGISYNENYIVVPCYKIGDQICWKSYVLSVKDLSIIDVIDDSYITKINSFNYAFSETHNIFRSYNLASLKLIWEKDELISTAISNDIYIFSFNFSDEFGVKMYCYFIASGEISWKSDFLKVMINTEFKLRNIGNLFKHKDTLWIALEDGSFILLDALSGTFIKHIINPNPVANAVTGYFHSAKLNRMVKLHNNHFHEIDMDTHEVRYWDIQDIPKGMVKAADDTHIYMLDWKRPIFYAFNIEMRCIDFAWAVPDDIKVQMTSPLISVKLSEDYVFVGTLNSEFLFVFDKENG